jgi:hypothetical protein
MGVGIFDKNAPNSNCEANRAGRRWVKHYEFEGSFDSRTLQSSQARPGLLLFPSFADDSLTHLTRI